jgi:hypothetical protein
MRREGERRRWARVELKPHFILDLRFLFFLGLMAKSTSIFSLVTNYTNTYCFFLCCNGLNWLPQFCFDPPNNLHPKPKSLSYPYLGMDLISALYIIFSKKIILSRYYMIGYHYFDIQR